VQREFGFEYVHDYLMSYIRGGPAARRPAAPGRNLSQKAPLRPIAVARNEFDG
jgi:hypothetical protein